MNEATRTVQRCPECGTQLEQSEAKAPASKHMATYAACPRCPFFNVERTPEHQAELDEKARGGR